MVIRLFASSSKVFTAAALMALGMAAVLQLASTAPATAAGSTVGVFAWGDNSSGELGNGNTTNSSTPMPVSLPSGVTPTAIAGGGGQGDPQPSQFAGYAIGSDGHLYAWGDNSRGALGNGDSPTNGSTPVVVSLPSGVTPTAIAASQGTGYAIGSDGHLYAWGDGTYGTLGNGTLGNGTFSDTPVVVSLPAGVTPTAIAGGFESAYAIGSDGHLYAWGDNFYGELGDGNDNSPTPVLVSLPSGVTPKAIAGGGGFALAIGSDGHLYAWGLNSNGALGDGSTTNSTTPVLVSLPSGVTPTAIAGGGAAAYAVGSDGHLYAWGLNSSGQLGNGSTTDSSTPVLVSLPSGVTPSTIAAGSGTGAVGSGGAAYAIGSDGHLYAWGNDNDGELGDGSNTNSSTPVLVSLPPGSTPQKLAPESGSASGYAIVNAAQRCTHRHHSAGQPDGQCGPECDLHRRGKWPPGPDGAVAGLNRPWGYLLTGDRSDQRHVDPRQHYDHRERKRVRGRLHQRAPGRRRPTRPRSWSSRRWRRQSPPSQPIRPPVPARLPPSRRGPAGTRHQRCSGRFPTTGEPRGPTSWGTPRRIRPP